MSNHLFDKSQEKNLEMEFDMLMQGTLGMKSQPNIDLTPKQEGPPMPFNFAFLFSAPLVLNYSDSRQNIRKSPIYMQVDYRAELEIVK